jgi:hypothetical protein
MMQPVDYLITKRKLSVVQPPETATTNPTPKKSLGTKMSKMFRGLSTNGPVASNDIANDDSAIRQVCEGELARYLMDAAKRDCPLVSDHDGSFGDPLKWWKTNGVRFPYIANAARILLAIPATSAPSERIWSRAARILTLKRARLDDELVERIMFIKENMKFLRKHYPRMMKEETEKHLHFLIDLEMQYFPCDEDELAEIDVGQNDDKLNF